MLQQAPPVDLLQFHSFTVTTLDTSVPSLRQIWTHHQPPAPKKSPSIHRQWPSSATPHQWATAPTLSPPPSREMPPTIPSPFSHPPPPPTAPLTTTATTESVVAPRPARATTKISSSTVPPPSSPRSDRSSTIRGVSGFLTVGSCSRRRGS